MGDNQRRLTQPSFLLSTEQHIGDMRTPGRTAAQRVVNTSSAFFRTFINVWLLFSALLCIYTYLWEPDSLYAAVVCIACGLMAKFFLRRGHSTLVRGVFITPFFILLMVSPWLVNGIRTPLLVHMMLLLIFTGWMLGTRMMWCFTASLSVMILTLWYVETRGLWAMPQPLRGVDMYLISLQFSLILTAIVLSVLIRNYSVDLNREVTWQQRLQSALDFNTLIIDSSPVPIRVFGPNGQCLAVNDAYAQLIGNTRTQLLAQSLHDSAMQTSGLTDQCLQVLHSGQATQLELQVTTNDGRIRWLTTHLVPFERHGQRHLLAHFIDMTEHRHATQELRQMAFHDSLTGLANRRLFWEHFQHASHLCARQQEWAAVLLLDLNRFKQLNDQHGHAAGDRMLQEVARRIQHTVRHSDLIARLGGDEFTLLVQGLGHTEAQAADNVQALHNKLHAALSAPYQLGDIQYCASASIGVALMDPTQPQDLDALLRQADAQMYAEKKSASADHLESALNI